MGFRSFATRLLSCCDDQVQPPRMVIGSPYGFSHVGGAELLIDPAVHEKSPSRTQNTGIDAFLANRRLGASTSSVHHTLRQHAKKLSDAMRCSLYSDCEEGGKQEDKEGLVARDIVSRDSVDVAEGAGDGGEQGAARTSSSSTAIDLDAEDEAEYVDASFASDHSEMEMDLDGASLAEPTEIVEAKTATVVSMKRYGSTDLLGLVGGSQNDDQR